MGAKLGDLRGGVDVKPTLQGRVHAIYCINPWVWRKITWTRRDSGEGTCNAGQLKLAGVDVRSKTSK
jgi:hypothetical protein